MRILYVTTIGITMGFFKSLIRELLDAGHAIDIVTNENGGETSVSACYREWGCRVFPISCSRSPLEKGNIAAVHEIKKIVQDGGYDIVHCHTPIAAACTRMACKGLRKGGVKVIYTAHGFHFYTGASIKNWLLYYPVEWLCAHWTDMIITINREDHERAKKHMHAKRVEYVPGVGIDVGRFANVQVDRAAKRRELGVPEDAVLLMSVGELNGNKNHATVIRALAKRNDGNLHYRIAGEGNLRAELEALAEALGVGERVRFLGYRRDAAELYACADIFVHPSIREGLPVAVMEAMAAGLPVIATDIRGSNDLLSGDGNRLIARYDDVDGFATAIAALASDGEERRRTGAANREKSRDYDVERINRRMLEIYAGE